MGALMGVLLLFNTRKDNMEAKMSYELIHEGVAHQYRFIIPHGAPLGEAYDAAFKALNQILRMAQEASEKVKPEEVQGINEAPADQEESNGN